MTSEQEPGTPGGADAPEAEAAMPHLARMPPLASESTPTGDQPARDLDGGHQPADAVDPADPADPADPRVGPAFSVAEARPPVVGPAPSDGPVSLTEQTGRHSPYTSRYDADWRDRPPPTYQQQLQTWGVPRRPRRVLVRVFGLLVVIALVVTGISLAAAHHTRHDPNRDYLGTTGEGAIVAGPAGTAPTVPGGDTVGALGSTFHLQGQLRGETADVTVTAVADPVVDPSGFDKPDAGGRFVGYAVTVLNVGSGVFEDSLDNDAKVTGSDGRVYRCEILGGDTDHGPTIDGLDLQPGASTSGYLVAQLPTGVTSTLLTVTVSSGFDQYGVWRLGASATHAAPTTTRTSTAPTARSSGG